MVAWWAYQGIGVLHLASHHRFYRCNRTPCRQLGDFNRGFAHHRLRVDIATCAAHRFHLVQILRRVGTGQVFAGGVLRLNRSELLSHPRDVEQIFNPSLGLRRFVMDIGLHHQTRLHQARVIARVMPHIQFMPHQTCFIHAALLVFSCAMHICFV